MATTAITHHTGFGHLTDLPCIELQYGAATAVVALYGAQVLSYQPTPNNELLWLSPCAQWHNNTAIRGGIPICWPWFGPVDPRLNPDRQTLPNHGVVRTAMWQLSGQHLNDDSVTVTLSITVPALPHHQQAVTLQLQLTLSEKLTVNLRCDTAIAQQAALHSYFAVTDLTKTRVQPLPLHYQDKVLGGEITAPGPVATVTAEVDRIYHQPASQLLLENAAATLSLLQCGYDATVVWNPWQEKSRQTSDLADDSYLDFICIETARLQLEQASGLDLTQQLIPAR